MLPIVLSFGLIKELASPDRRAVGFLEGHGQLNAAQVFANLRSKDKDRLYAFMDHWCDKLPAKAYHGWKNDPYKECMVFRLNDNRFYGFMCNPSPQSDLAFLLCVLCIHAYKHEWDTDTAELDRVNDWHASQAADRAIAKVYPEYGKEKCKRLKN